MAKKVMVGIVTYDGKIVTSIVGMLLEMTKYVEIEMYFVDGCSLLPVSRNEVLTGFVKHSIADYLLMLDADNFIDPTGVHKLCKYVKQNVDHCVSARIPYRRLATPKVGPWGDQDAEGFVESVGAACLLIPRKVAVAVAETCDLYEAYCPHSQKTEEYYEAFRISIITNPKEGCGPCMQGEDVFFTKKIHEVGSRILLDDDMEGYHVGTHLFDFRTQAIYKKAMMDLEKAGLPR